MAVIRHHPAAPLDRYVRCFWWSRRDEPQTACEHMLPGCGAQLIFALHESPIISMPASSPAVTWSGGVVRGPQRRYYIAGPKPRGVVVGVSFHPGGAGAVLGVPIMELTDRHVPIDDFWGQRGSVLHERLTACRSPASAFRLLAEELTAHLRRPLLIHPAVMHALTVRAAAGASIRVADVHREAGYSARHFIAMFRSAVGLTPKHYYRVQRFTMVLRQLATVSAASPAAARGANLADIAVAAGYADQPHLTRDFRDFAGITPMQYRPRDAASLLHHTARNAEAASSPGNKYSR